MRRALALGLLEARQGQFLFTDQEWVGGHLRRGSLGLLGHALLDVVHGG